MVRDPGEVGRAAAQARARAVQRRLTSGGLHPGMCQLCESVYAPLLFVVESPELDDMIAGRWLCEECRAPLLATCNRPKKGPNARQGYGPAVVTIGRLRREHPEWTWSVAARTGTSLVYRGTCCGDVVEISADGPTTDLSSWVVRAWRDMICWYEEWAPKDPLPRFDE